MHGSRTTKAVDLDADGDLDIIGQRHEQYIVSGIFVVVIVGK